jgi:hypothetical protein
MVSRKANEDAKVQGCLADIISGARVFLSGGQELPVISMRETVERGCEQVLSRLYPKFNQADSASWPVVWKKAKEGNSGALSALGYNGDPDKHPVSAELLRFIGSGKKGSEIYATFTGGSYGWPKEAIDATLATLLASEHLGARLNGQPVKLTDLDQRKTTQADYRVENPVLTAPQKLRIRKLYQTVSHTFTPGDELAAAPGFITALQTLAANAGGDAPAPERPHSPILVELLGLTGNDLLFKIHENADDLTALTGKWLDLAKKIRERTPDYQICESLLAYANSSGLPVAGSQNAALDAVLQNRQLLDDPNPLDPIRQALSDALRKAIHAAHSLHEQTLNDESSRLDAQPVWSTLTSSKKAELLSRAGAIAQTKPITGTDAELLVSLQQCDLVGWQTQTDAISTRCQQALATAIKEAVPKAKRVTLPAATIQNATELDAWVAKARSAIEDVLKDGPAIV